MAVFAKKSADDYSEMHGVYRRYFVLDSITARYPVDVPCITIALPSPEVLTGVKRGARRQPGRGAGASQSLPCGSGTSQMPPPPGLGFASFQAPHTTSFEFFGFRAPHPSGTAGSSTLYQPILQASSSDEEERVDDMDGVQHY
ncbi:hypothetical protein M9H77_18137 [Catharanthus roseus]|uniref:Uncharacterized protein n=1 Tax=Catharanthus roseus TaxID=4058 RepID=A0ACC0B6L1_CATRO|nr:hypothetical protein M9H77_18137 [Catharanthus roseus]